MLIVKCNEKFSTLKETPTVIFLIRNFNVRYSKHCKAEIKTLAS